MTWFTEADGSRRVQLATSDDNGATFSDPIILSEDSTMGRVDLSVADDGTVYTSWLSTQDDNGFVMMRSVSNDGSLGEPIRVGITSSSRRSGFPRMASTEDGLLFAWTQTDPRILVRTAIF